MTVLLEIANTFSCGLMLAYMLIIAFKMPGGLRMLGRKLVVMFVSAMLAFQIVAPWDIGVTNIAWHGAMLHTGLALALLFWRREAMAFIACKFVVPDVDVPRRRTSDWAPLDEAEFSKVVGRGK